MFLRERKSTNLPTMLKYALDVESNLMAFGKIRQKAETNRRTIREENQDSTSSSTYAKFYVMMRTMERMAIEIKPQNREQ